MRLPEAQILSNRIRERARLAWPQVELDIEPFVGRVLSLIDSKAPAREALNNLAVEDLFLAYACGNGDAIAFKAFTKDCEVELKAVAQKLRISESDLDDARQILWGKLFLESAGHSKKILEYRGAGRLRHWFRVLAARTILDELRKTKRNGNQQFFGARQHSLECGPQCGP